MRRRKPAEPAVIKLILLAFVFGGAVFASDSSIASDRVKIPGGKFAPLYGLEKDQKEFTVHPFELDRLPVTRKEFKEFLDRFPEWRPDRVKRLFAEEKYLSDWEKKAGKYSPKKDEEHYPVVNVSYFAAQSYCQSKGGRLPSTLEWEYAAAASEKKPNASRDPEFASQILAWYSSSAKMGEVGKSRPNFYGLNDMHGLVWQWTSDYNSSFVTADNRQDGEKTKDFFCGSGSIGAENREAYAAFMRYAMRGTLAPSYTIERLGFRCAYDSK